MRSLIEFDQVPVARQGAPAPLNFEEHRVPSHRSRSSSSHLAMGSGAPILPGVFQGSLALTCLEPIEARARSMYTQELVIGGPGMVEAIQPIQQSSGG